ncbi:hypothetical protein GCM10027093_66590 [Paraburkholderia jirisanensis]
MHTAEGAAPTNNPTLLLSHAWGFCLCRYQAATVPLLGRYELVDVSITLKRERFCARITD